MIKKIYSSTLKQIIINPITITFFVLELIYSLIGLHRYTIKICGIYCMNYLPTIFNCVININMITQIILMIIFSLSIMNDKDNCFYQIELPTQMKQKTYLNAKFFAYISFYLFWFIFFITIHWSAFYLHGFVDIEIPFFETLIRYIVSFLVLVVPTCIFSVCIVMTISIISKSKITGLIISVLYCLVSNLISHSFITFPPDKLWDFYVIYQKKGQLNLLIPNSSSLHVFITMFSYIVIGLILYSIIYFIYTKKTNIFD